VIRAFVVLSLFHLTSLPALAEDPINLFCTYRAGSGDQLLAANEARLAKLSDSLERRIGRQLRDSVRVVEERSLADVVFSVTGSDQRSAQEAESTFPAWELTARQAGIATPVDVHTIAAWVEAGDLGGGIFGRTQHRGIGGSAAADLTRNLDRWLAQHRDSILASRGASRTAVPTGTSSME
jgi:hypothetical protein